MPQIKVAILLCVICLIPVLCFCQPRAGIKANGKTLKRGDTVLLCKFGAINFEAVSGNGTITWQFQNGSVTSATGAGPFSISYNSSGLDSVIQRVSSGTQRDSTFIFVQVSDVKPVPNFSFTPNNDCGNVPVQFTNNTVVSGLSFLWDFKDGGKSPLINPSHAFLNATGTSGTQTYKVSLTATDKYGCVDSAINEVTVQKIPDASIGKADPNMTFLNFNGTPTFRNCTNTATYNFKFQNASTTLPINLSYNIKWGDGSRDTTLATWDAGTILNHTYSIGSHTLTVNVKGANGCTGIKTYNVFLGTNPAGGFSSPGNTDICGPDSLTFIITGYKNNSPGTIYTVSVNDATVDKEFTQEDLNAAGTDSVTHLFNFSSCGYSSSNGTVSYSNSFRSTLTISNACNSTSVSVIPIYVSARPEAAIYRPENVCINSNAYIQNISNMGDVITATGGGSSTCSSSGKQVWQITPATGYTVSSGTLGSLNGNFENGLLWANGSSSLNLKFTQPGTYTVKLYVSNDRCGSDSTVSTICVRDIPKTSFTLSNPSFCESGKLTIKNTSPKGGCDGDTYIWSINYTDPLDCNSATGNSYSYINNTTATSFEPQFQLNNTGMYIITASATAVNSSNTCPIVSSADTVFIKGKPKVTINPVPVVCVNNVVNASTVVSNCYGDSSLKYNWVFTNGKPGTSKDSLPLNITYAATGTYAVKLDVKNECGTTGDIDSVQVIAKPIANAGPDKNICSGTPVTIGTNTGNFVYQWASATGLSSTTIAQPTVTLLYNGSQADTVYRYVVNISAGTDCVSTDTVLVKVRKSPMLSSNPLNPSICEGDSIWLMANGATTYTWQTASSLYHIKKDSALAKPDTTTTYTVVGAFANGCTDTLDVPVIAYKDAIASFTAARTAGCISFKLASVIDVVKDADRNNTYTWYADGLVIGSNTTGEFPANFEMSTPGDTAVIKLVVTSSHGCNQDSMQMQFVSLPAVNAKFSKDITGGCGPLKVNFNNTSSLTNGVDFFWDFGNGKKSTAIQPGSVTFNSSVLFNDTTYYITLKAYNGCDTTYWYDSVHVSPGPYARFGITNTFGCSPFSLDINNTSLGFSTAYYWSFGNGDRDTTFNKDILHYTYTTNRLDTFTIRLIAENACGRDEQRLAVIVAPNEIKPFININASQLFGCAPHTVGFNNGTIGASKYTWNFQDGSAPLITTSNQASVIHTFLNPGDYNVKIDITNGCSDTTVYRLVTVFDKPVPSFTLDKPVMCITDTVHAASTSLNADTYRWNWGDGSLATGDSIEHFYRAPGSYTVTLYASRTNNFGIVCTDYIQQVVQVINKPDVAISSNAAGINCLPFAYTASAPNLLNESVTWTVMDSTRINIIFTTTDKQLLYTFKDAGLYYVKLYAENVTGCGDTSIISFRTYYTPTSLFTPLSVNSCSTDTTIAFLNQSSYPYSRALRYAWFINGKQTAQNENISYRFTLPQNATDPLLYNVWLTATNPEGCTDTSRGTVTLYPSAKANFTLINQATCTPFNAVINNGSVNATHYQWLVNNTAISNDVNPSFLFDKGSTQYTVTLIAWNDYSCKPDTSSVTFTSLAKPVATFTLNDSVGCGGQLNVVTKNLSTGANSYLWSWSDGSANSNLPSPTHLYTNLGQYLISLVVSDGTCSDTAYHYATIENKPVVDFAVSNTSGCDTVAVNFTNLTGNAVSYTWYFGDGTSSEEVNPSKAYPPSNAPYTVKLVAKSLSGCIDSIVKPNIVTAIFPPHADFVVNPSQIIVVPDYNLNFLNTTINLPNYSYLWLMGDGTQIPQRDINNYKYRDTGIYPVRLIVADLNTNCIDTALKIIEIRGVPGYLFVPNAFCPRCVQPELRNFLPKGKGLKTYKIQILTTWGQPVFESTSLDAAGAPNEGWNGNDKSGKLIQQDVYMWKIDATFVNGTEWKGMLYPYSSNYKRIGTITVLR